MLALGPEADEAVGSDDEHRGAPDASPAALRSVPRDLTEWQTVASASRVVGLDNISRINEELSDAFCRAVTGEGAARRQL